MRSALASETQADGSAVPCAAWSALPASSTACHSDARHAVRSPPPQKRVRKGERNVVPVSVAQVLVDEVEATAREAAARSVGAPGDRRELWELGPEHR